MALLDRDLQFHSLDGTHTSRSRVSLVHIDDQRSVQAAVRCALELIDWRQFISPGADVSLKLNLGWDLFLPGAVSSPWAVEGLIQTLLDSGHVGKIYAVESNQILVDAETTLEQTGIGAILRAYGIPWVNMSHGKFQPVHLEGGLAIHHIEVPEILLQTEVITVPVLKAHGRTVMTGAIKNQWGCLRELRHNYHPVVDQALTDVNRVVRPRLALMDGSIGLEGNGPKSGIPRVCDLVLASGDIVAIDTVASQIMGFDPEQIRHIQQAAEAGIGVAERDRIEVVGVDAEANTQPVACDIPKLEFKRGKNNQVAIVEILLRQGPTRKLVFETRVLDLMCWGAKVWYWWWYHVFAGTRMRDSLYSHPRYGSQWPGSPVYSLPGKAGMRCLSCGAVLPQRSFLHTDELEIRRCLSCGLDVAHHTALDAAAGDNYFEGMSLNEYRAYYEPLRRRAARAALKHVARLRGGDTSPGSVLDIGCGWGWFLDVCKQAGWTVQGLEPSAQMAQLARDTYGIPVEQGGADDLDKLGGSYDLVTLWNVLEHLSDPPATLSKLQSHIAPDGMLGIAVPNAGGLFARLARLLARAGIAGPLHTLYQTSNPHPHLYHFDQQTLIGLLQRAGYRVVAAGQQDVIDPKNLRVRATMEGKRASIWAGNPIGRAAIRALFAASRRFKMRDELIVYAKPCRAPEAEK